MRKLLTTILLPFWTISSFGAGPSRPLVINDNFGGSVSRSVREAVGVDVSFSGKIAASAAGNLMFLLGEPVGWTYLDEEGEAQSVNASVFEYSLVEGKVVDAFEIAPAMTEEGETLEISVDDLVYEASTGTYYGLDLESQKLFAFEYGPDQPVTVMMEKTRMVEVVIPPEPLVVDEVKIAVPTEQAASVEMATEGLEEDDGAVTKSIASVKFAVGETQTPSASEQAVPVIEPDGNLLGNTIDLAPAEVPEILEEVEETIVEKTKWVEESYEEAVTVMETHKFGHVQNTYDLSVLGLEALADLYFDDTTGTLVLLGQSNAHQWKLIPIVVEGGNIVSSEQSVELTIENTPLCLFVDPVTKHWVVATDTGMDLYARDGRLLRSITEALSMEDACRVVSLNEAGEHVSVLYMATDSSFGELKWERSGEERVHHVPGEFATIQEAIDGAAMDDWILLSPGEYHENVTLQGKGVNLTSYYQLSKELYFLEHTVIKPEAGVGLTIAETEGTSAFVSGLRFSNADIAISSSSNLTLENSEILGNKTGLSFSGGTAMIADCDISGNSGNGVRYLGATASLLERCNITENGGHGIQVDITPYDGVLFRTVIRRNNIRTNQGSGIYFLDQPITSQREFRIENNFIVGNGKAGVEVYLEQPDPKQPIPTGPRTKGSVSLVNNTIVNNPVGVLGGGNYRMVNNIVAGSEVAGVKNLLFHTLIIRNLFWENGENAVESNFNTANNREEDPLFVGDDYILSVRSPAKHAGIPGNLWNDTSDRSGADIGASR